MRLEREQLLGKFPPFYHILTFPVFGSFGDKTAPAPGMAAYLITTRTNFNVIVYAVCTLDEYIFVV